MGQLLSSKEGYYITQDGHGPKAYYTAVHDLGLHKHNPHSHLHSYKQASLVIHWAKKGKIPNRYSSYMQEAIRRLLKTKEEVLGELSK